MERVAFLIEDTKERLGCMLNPETLEIRRQAGVRPRPAGIGSQRDEGLLMTGGGLTEVRLDLLFDIGLSGSSVASEDVRSLTGPIWRLAENRTRGPGRGRVPQVRFIWGKHWNIPGVVAAVAERLDRFAPSGAPQRSWLRMRLLRTESPAAPGPALVLPGPEALAALTEGRQRPTGSPGVALTVLGSGSGAGRTSERLDAIAGRMYGDPGAWRAIAAVNRIDDPLHLPVGGELHLPTAGGAP